MSNDISYILQNWDFDPFKSYRKIVGDDGREKVQVRVDNAAFQGVLQMELDGRPDGRRPYGHEYAFDYYRLSLKRFEGAHGSDENFDLDKSACDELFDESSRIYNRYVFLLQLQDYSRVIRDTERNMELFRFVNRYAVREKDRKKLERWWPYILRINATARAMLMIRDNQDFDSALWLVKSTLTKIKSLPELEIEEFTFERKRSVNALEEMAKAISSNKPMSEIEKLHTELSQAVEEERFEDAARIRDQIKSQGKGVPSEDHPPKKI